MGQEAGSPRTYVTVSGDRWDGIAYAVLGDERYAWKMMELNPEHTEAFVFPAGITLILPDKEATAAAVAPPWKRLTR